jgi:hypothetical protein
MRSDNGVLPHVALTPAALTFLNVSVRERRAARRTPIEPLSFPAPGLGARNSIHHQISFKPTGFPFSRVTL